MQVTAEKTDPCTIVLDIAVDEPQVSRAFDSSFREFSRYVNVPGFRPGKAPRVLVERYVDMGRLRQHTLEKIVRETYPRAIEEQSITPFRDPHIESTDLEDKKPYTYKAIVPLDPQVTLGEYTGLTVEKPIFNITDKDVEERIQRLREDRARLDRVTDRGVQEGDILIAENQVTLEGEENTEPARRQLVYMGNNIPGYDEAVMGMMPGDERTFELTYPNDYEEEDKRGKKATFQVTLSSISARKLPELTDDFAKEVANVETVEELRSLIRTRLEAEAKRVSDELAEQRLIEEILKGAEIHYPQVLVREELNDKLRQLGEDLSRNKMTYEQYLERIERTAEQHQSQLAAQSAEQIRALLALRQIAVQEDLQADDTAIDAEFDRLKAEGSLPEETLEQYRADPQHRLQIANALIQQKLHDFLFANNTLNEVVQATTPEAAEAAANAEAERETDAAAKPESNNEAEPEANAEAATPDAENPSE